MAGHLGVAHDEKEFKELKRLAKVIMLQIIDERKGPFLFSKEALESKEEESNSEPQAKHIPSKENSKKSTHCRL